MANVGDNTISRVTPGGVVSTFASGFTGPRGLAFDTSGNLLVANYSDGTISRVTSTGTTSTFVSGLNSPWALAFGPTAAVPEPSQLVLLGGAAVAAAGYASWRRKKLA